MPKVKWLKVKYEVEAGQDQDLDMKITEFFEGLGFHRWASGRDNRTAIRDIFFDGLEVKKNANKDKA